MNRQIFFDPQRKRWKRLRRIFDVSALLLTIVAMFARNLLILALFSPSAVLTAAGPLLAMTVVALIFVRRARASIGETPTQIHLESPVSLKRVLTFAAFFLSIQIISTLGERYLGKLGFLGISILGGLVSSASTSAAAANGAGQAMLPAASVRCGCRPHVAGVAAGEASGTWR